MTVTVILGFAALLLGLELPQLGVRSPHWRVKLAFAGTFLLALMLPTVLMRDADGVEDVDVLDPEQRVLGCLLRMTPDVQQPLGRRQGDVRLAIAIGVELHVPAPVNRVQRRRGEGGEGLDPPALLDRQRPQLRDHGRVPRRRRLHRATAAVLAGALVLAGCGTTKGDPDADLPDAEPAPTAPPPPAALGAGAGTLTSATYTFEVFLGAPVASQPASGSTNTLTPTTPIEL